MVGSVWSGRPGLVMALASVLAAALLAAVPMAGAEVPASVLVRLDPVVDRLVAGDAVMERVATGFGFTEGPVWVPRASGGYLLFTDVPGNIIHRYDPALRRSSVHLANAGFTGPDIWRWGGMNGNGYDKDDPRYERFAMIGPDGLGLDRQGRLILATFSGRSIVRIERDGRRTTLADSYQGKKFNGTNDLAVKSDGAVYFTDTFGGLRLRAEDPRRGVPFNGVYRVKDGIVTLLAHDMPSVNGIVFSPDERYLYVNGSVDNYVRRYPVLADGTLGPGAPFADMRGLAEAGVTDGMRVDRAGNLYVTGPGGVWIVTPEGKHIGTIRVPERPIHVAFGDADRRTLYIAAHTSVYRVRVKLAGL